MNELGYVQVAYLSGRVDAARTSVSGSGYQISAAFDVTSAVAIASDYSEYNQDNPPAPSVPRRVNTLDAAVKYNLEVNNRTRVVPTLGFVREQEIGSIGNTYKTGYVLGIGPRYRPREDLEIYSDFYHSRVGRSANSVDVGLTFRTVTPLSLGTRFNRACEAGTLASSFFVYVRWNF